MLASRISKIFPSATLAIDAKAKWFKKKGKDVLNLGAGEPDSNTPENIKQAAKRTIDNNITRYTPVAGIPELREAIAKKFQEQNKISYNASEVLVTNGGKQAIYSIASAILNEGDEAILPAPYWTSFEEIIKLAGANPVFCKTDDKFRVAAKEIEKKITAKTKMLVLNSPCNPSGAVVPKGEAEKIAEIALNHNLYILSDEVYEHFIYGKSRMMSIASLNADAKRLTITVNSFSKTYAMTGWRIGYCGASKELISALENFQSHASGNISNISQMAALEALNGPQDSIKEMVRAFDQRRKFMHKRLNEIPGVRCSEPEGAFYAFPDISDTGMESMEFSSKLLDEALVAVVPGTAFGLEGHVRLSYAASMSDIEQAMHRIEKWLKGKTK